MQSAYVDHTKIILPPGVSVNPYPRTKRHGFKVRCAWVWSRANADDHGKLVRKKIDAFILKNLCRWHNIRITEADLLDDKT